MMKMQIDTGKERKEQRRIQDMNEQGSSSAYVLTEVDVNETEGKTRNISGSDSDACTSYCYVYHESFPCGRISPAETFPWEKWIAPFKHGQTDKKLEVTSEVADSRVYIVSSYDVDLNDLMTNLWLWEVKFEIFFVEDDVTWGKTFSPKEEPSLFHLLPLIVQADFVWWKVQNYKLLAHSFSLNQQNVNVSAQGSMKTLFNEGNDGSTFPPVNISHVLGEVLNPLRRLKVGYSMLSTEK
eukprot:759189-Hanusia_phi.AAC.1